MQNATHDDRSAIKALIEDWAIWRDAGQWEKLLTVWHSDGRMNATWFQGSAAEFISASKAGWECGVSVLHFLGGTSIEFCGARAIAQTKMTITQRAPIQGIVCDCICIGRFYDFFERRQGKWGLVLRQPIYERDRIDPVDTGASLVLNSETLMEYPEGYRHIAYLQRSLGMPVKQDLPGITGPAVEALYLQGEQWLFSATGGSPAPFSQEL